MLGPGNGAVREDFDLGPCDSLGQSLENLHEKTGVAGSCLLWKDGVTLTG